MSYKCLIYSDWFDKNKINNIKLNINKNIDIFIDQIPIIDNNNYKIFIVTEPTNIIPSIKNYIISNYYKFDLIITFDNDILQLPNTKICLYGTSWVNRCDYIKYENSNVSFIIGNKNSTDGHNLRHKLYNRKYEIKQNLDVYISTNNPIENIYNDKYLIEKNDIFNKDANYGYHLCIENSRQINYFSEKIMDCFQTMTITIYWGAPNINDFFDINGIIILDSNDPDEIINIINSYNLIDFYNNNIKSIIYNYNKCVEYLNYDDRIINIINNIN